ncbi:hypothetical protein Pelo_5036 [Pelomyxa schiedti]|nr:hypothetical protein Pelo_5036 [Pelomyxa schiedti]
MPQSKKDLRKLKQRQAAERGEKPAEKKAPNTFAQCTVCKVNFRTTKRNVELAQHAATHPKSSFEACFPGETHE